MFYMSDKRFLAFAVSALLPLVLLKKLTFKSENIIQKNSTSFIGIFLIFFSINLCRL